MAILINKLGNSMEEVGWSDRIVITFEGYEIFIYRRTRLV